MYIYIFLFFKNRFQKPATGWIALLVEIVARADFPMRAGPAHIARPTDMGKFIPGASSAERTAQSVDVTWPT